MKKFTMQFSFATCGEEHLEHIRDLRQKLTDLKGQPLDKVYAAFDIIPLTKPTNDDVLEKVDIVRTTRADKLYAFFVIGTTTQEVPHTELWKGVCKSVYPHVRLDVVGNDTENNRHCHELLVPPGIDYYHEEE